MGKLTALRPSCCRVNVPATLSASIVISMLSAMAQPAAAVPLKGNRVVVAQPAESATLALNASTGELLHLSEAATSVFVADQDMASFMSVKVV